MKLSRGRFIAAGAAGGALASIGILRWPGEAAQFSYKLANDQTPTHPMNVATVDAIKRINEASNGQLEIKLFPNSLLGGDPQMLAQLRSGAVELLQIGNNILGSVIPSAALLGVPFAFHNAQQYDSAANGPLGAYIGSAGAAIGLRKFETSFYGGFFEMQNRVRPINAPADLSGLKIRVPPGPIDVGTFKALGAAPTVITLSEVYTSLQTHLIDGIEVPLPTVRNFKFYEQVKFCSLTHHSGLAYMLFAGGDAWQKLPKNLQEILDRELGAAAANGSKLMASQESSVEAELTSDGMAFNRPALEPFSAVIRASGLYKQLREQYDPKGWDMLEKTTGKLV
ncbi:MAG TPA: TRAP transporter substrate-binding protein [Candidatus Elarobacter sp.]|jgi:tripartite ATP-independent transporter DctP family solute receptor|nr:TRAP transporter substrate-binding protein [Candidatus Elarobacter sp.]